MVETVPHILEGGRVRIVVELAVMIIEC